MPDRHPDWAWIASLPSLFVRGSDLARVELFQQGRLGTPLRLTQAGRRAVGRARTFVVRDPDSTPLLVATLTGDRLEAQSLRPVEEIARRVSLSVGTVRNYLSSATTKVGGANRHEAAALARARGWI